MDDELPDVLQFPNRPGGVAPEVVTAVEALIFASGDPVSTQRLADVLSQDLDEIRLAIQVLQSRFRGPERGIHLERVAAGWQLRSSPVFGGQVLQLLGHQPTKLSRAALEILSVIAYRQPCTRHEIDVLRGVDSGGVLRKLLDKKLVRVSGRRDEPGRPLEYRTSNGFLEMFGMPDLSALPQLRDRVPPERDDALPLGEGEE